MKKPFSDNYGVTPEGMVGLHRRLLVLVLVALIPALGLILYNAKKERDIRTSAIRDNAQRIVQLAVIRHNRLIDSTHQLLALLAEVPDIKNSKPSCRRILRGLLDQYPHYASFGVIRPDGGVSCSALEFAGSVNVADRAYFRRALETKSFSVGDYQIGKINDKASIGFALPVIDERGAVTEILFAALDLSWLNTLAAEIELPEGATLSILDSQATVLAAFPNPEKWLGRKLPEAPVFKAVQAQGRGADEFKGFDGVQRLYAFTALGSEPDKERVHIIAGIPEESASSEVQPGLLRNLFWLGVAALLAIATAWFVGKNFIVKFVDERARAEEMRLQLAAIVESCEDAIVGKTLDGRITSWNSGAERIFGYSAEEVLGRSITLLNPPDRPNEIPQVLEMVKQRKGLNRYETERIRKDGRRLCVSASVSAIKDPQGNIVGVSTIARDITVAKNVEEKLRAHASQMETLYTVAQEVGGTLALEEILERALARVVSATGFELAFIHVSDAKFERRVYGGGQSMSSQHALEVLRRMGAACDHKLATCEKVWLVENAEVVPDLQPAYTAGGMRGVAVLPLSGNDQFRGTLTLMSPRVHTFIPEESQFFQALAQQIGLAIENATLFSATVRMNEHLQNEIEVRKRTEKTLADFTAMVVHDLRSPLANIISIIESLRHELFGSVNEQQAKWLQKMQNNCLSLVDHISDFLDFSKIEAGHVELVRRPVNLAPLIYESFVEHSIQADKGNIRLAAEIQDDLPLLSLDARRLNQVLGNLLSNALKFTPEGGEIEVGARSVDEADVVVWVKDTGVGIPEDEVGLIFEAYRQLSSGKKSHSPGTGLGLAICKKIVEAHGGRIWADSEENKGTVFYFSLPIKGESTNESLEAAFPLA